MDNLKNASEEEVKEAISKTEDQEWELCGRDFWYWCQFVTTVDEETQEIRYMPLDCDQLHKTKWEMDNNKIIIFLKARRQMLSWLAMLRELHAAMFCGSGIEGTANSYRAGIMTIGETEAKYLIERPTETWKRFPDWMKRRNPLVTDNQLFMKFQKGGTIQAFPMKREGPQSFGFSSVVFDEMALQEAAYTTWVGMLPTLGQFGRCVAISTPNGKLNFFHRVWRNKNNEYKGIKRMYIHWDGTHKTYENGKWTSEWHPEKQLHDQNWYDGEDGVINGLGRNDIARMYQGSFAAYAGQPVWDLFEKETHVKPDFDIDEMSPVFVCWDFGYHYPAVTIWQRNNRDQWIGIAEYEEFDVSFDTFCANVLVFVNSLYDRGRVREIHFCDPAGNQRYSSKSRSGAYSDMMEIKAVFGKSTQIRTGALEVGTQVNEGPRLKEVRKLWKLRADGQPGVLLSENMKTFIEGCEGGYSYPEKGGEVPMKNEASHLQDTFQYGVTGYNRMTGNKPKGQTLKKKHVRIGRRTGM